jgi:hydroxymethylbilane synthase
MPEPEQETLVLATRRSPLARRQTDMARAALAAWPQAWWKAIELLELTTTGDRQATWPLANEGGKGLFTRELEEALISGRAHLAVHSAKDLPTTLPDGLALAGFLPRADARDVLVRRAEISVPRKIASGSPRRRTQAEAWWPGAEWTELRGNLDTRLKKIAAGEADATFLAAAGLRRLGIESFEGLVFEPISIEKMVPAAGQGAIALESRTGDAVKFGAVFCAKTARAVFIERAALGAMGGGCHAASAAYYDGDALHVFHAAKGREKFVVNKETVADAVAATEVVVTHWIKTA